MRKQIIITVVGLLLGLSFSTELIAQKDPKNNNSTTARIQKHRPTLYIALDRSGVIKDRVSGKETNWVWFRLENNSRWGIRIDTSGGKKPYDDAKLFYETVDRQGNIEKSYLCHVCSVTILGPGKNLRFSIPAEQLEKAAAFRIGFSYAWEDDLDVSAGLEPIHYLFFYLRNLPGRE